MGTSRRYCVCAATLLSCLAVFTGSVCAQNAASAAPVVVAQTDAPQPVDVIQNIPIYFAKSKQFLLPNLAATQTTAPALTAWACTDQGQTWSQSVNFSAGQATQTVTAADGVYWFCFSPGNAAPPRLAKPDLIYIVDTAKPAVAVKLSPAPFDPQSGKAHAYRVGDVIRVEWAITDPYLDDTATTVATSFAKYPHNLVWTDIKAGLPARASIELTIPAQAATQDGVRFRVVARDKAGNLALAMTPVIRIQGATPAAPAAVVPSAPTLNQRIAADLAKTIPVPTVPAPAPVAPAVPTTPAAPMTPPVDLLRPVEPATPLAAGDTKRFEDLLPETVPEGPASAGLGRLSDTAPKAPAIAVKPAPTQPENPSEFLAPISPAQPDPAPIAPIAPVAPVAPINPADVAPAPPSTVAIAPAPKARTATKPETTEDVLAEVDAIIAAHRAATTKPAPATPAARPAAPIVIPASRPAPPADPDMPAPPVELRQTRRTVPRPMPTTPRRPVAPAPPVSVAVAPKPVAPAPPVATRPKPAPVRTVAKPAPVRTVSVPAHITRPAPTRRKPKPIVTHPEAPTEFLKPIDLHDAPKRTAPRTAPKPAAKPAPPVATKPTITIPAAPKRPAPKLTMTIPASIKPEPTPAPAPRPEPVLAAVKPDPSSRIPLATATKATIIKAAEFKPAEDTVTVRPGRKLDTFPTKDTPEPTAGALPSGPVELGEVDTPKAPAITAKPAPATEKKQAAISFLESLETKSGAKTGSAASNGWPVRGMVLRGSSQQLLNWLPAEARTFKTVSLRFSSDNGKTWKTVATNLREKQTTLWTVPAVDSASCRIDLIGTNPSQSPQRLALSDSFHVETSYKRRSAGPTIAPAPVKDRPRVAPRPKVEFVGPAAPSTR
ncbi:MAG: hypothetical protein HN909_08725 [Phycisphaerales bacterium]|jgi:hypothetical protein|nr:hypothetical protein [Phycisphaerales bacterium]MBT7171837.1 hypothetical protein [Phycisphaerales bacterium]